MQEPFRDRCLGVYAAVGKEPHPDDLGALDARDGIPDPAKKTTKHLMLMNRRDSLRLLGIGTLSAGAVLEGCQPKADSTNKAEEGAPALDETGRQDFEAARDKDLLKQKFFDAHEMTTITI